MSDYKSNQTKDLFSSQVDIPNKKIFLWP